MHYPEGYDLFEESELGAVFIHPKSGEVLVARKKLDCAGNQYFATTSTYSGFCGLQTNPPPDHNPWIEKLFAQLTLQRIRAQQCELGVEK